MKHLPDCAWIAGLDDKGCLCAERIFLESCTPEEAAHFRRNNPITSHVLDVSATTWAPHRRSA